VKNKPAEVLATWFWCGYSPFAPGTVGSIGALIPAYFAVRYWHVPAWAFAIAAALLFAPAVWAAGVAERQSGRTDPGLVVVDEVIGQWITLAGAGTFNWKVWLTAFILFRAFDIFKPWPVRKFESLHGGLGIVADDAMAGIYGALVLFVLQSLSVQAIYGVS
jgi:phosphatidylglycerophosphatase A